MANSVQKDWNGPDWPLGFIKVVTPGTPVNIMSLVDSSNLNAPQTATPGNAGANEYTVRAQQMIFQGVKPGVTGMTPNTGNVYIVRYAARNGTGTGNYADPGCIVGVLWPGGSFAFASAPLNRNVFNPYRYYLDADNADDGALVTLIIQ